MTETSETLTKLQELTLQYNRLVEDRDLFLKDLKHTKKILNRTQNVTLVEDLMNNRKSSNKILTIPSSSKQSNKKSNIHSKLALYELTSGIHIETISMQYFPIYDKDITDPSWFEFEVDAFIDSMKFHLTYVSNQNLEICYNNKITNYDIKKLDIKMTREIHQVELQKALDYFSINPSKMALAMNCLTDYNKLFKERLNITKILCEENKELIQCNLIIEDDNIGYLEITASNKSTSREYFNLKWKIVWNEIIYTVIDSFQISVPYQEEEFIQSITHNFSILCKENSTPDVRLLKDRKSNKNQTKPNHKTEETKLKLLRNAMLAVKVAEDI